MAVHQHELLRTCSVFFFFVAAHVGGSTLEGVEQFLDEYEIRAQEFYSASALADWNYNTNITDFNENKSVEARTVLAAFKTEAAHNVSQFDGDFPELIQRQLDVISFVGTAALEDANKVREFNQVRSSMMKIYNQAKVCRTIGTKQECYNLDPELENIMSNSDVYEELKWAWEAWRDKVGVANKDLYIRFVELSNQVAVANGFADKGAMWRDNYEMGDDIIDVAYDIYDTISPVYRQLHAYVRRKLHAIYGEHIDVKRRIPACVLGDMWGRFWGTIHRNVVPYPDRPNVDVTDAMVKQMKKRRGRNVNGTAGRETVDAYEVLRSMGYSSRLPDVINIGVKKGGTTALMFYLKNHPQKQTSLDAREVHYFDWHYNNGPRWYESRMKVARNDQLVYEKTPRYYIHDHVARRIHRDLGGDLRFLLCVRDPVSRLISDFHFSKQIRASKGWKKQQTAEKEGNRFIKTILEMDGSIKIDNEMVSSSHYAIHFKRWLKYYRRDQFLIIDNSEMVNNISEALRQVEAFLGLRPFYQKSMFLKTKKDQTCLRIDSRTSCPRKIGASILPKPKVSPELEQKLRDYYRPHNKKFEILAGRKFDWADL